MTIDCTLDDNGGIERIDENDGGFWIHDYDARHRLTSAVYTTDWGHEAEYGYTYDDGDNMTQKVEPFADDFNDGNYTGWNTSGGGTWSASTYAMRNDVNTSAAISFYKNVSVNDSEIRFSYLSEDTSNNNYYLRCILRNNSSTRIDVRFYPNKAQLWEWNGTTWTSMDLENSATTSEDTWYDVVAKLDGGNVSVSRAERGQSLAEILSTTSSGVTTNQQLWFQVNTSAQFQVDDVKIINGDSFSTWTMTPNNANELTQMANSAQGATIDFAYDAYGRTTEKAIGNNAATYAWRYGSKLASVDTSIPAEGDVTYTYGGDRKRRRRSDESTYTWYNWSGWNLISEENNVGVLQKSYSYKPHLSGRMPLSEVPGSTPANAPSSYYLHDHLGSTRALYDQDRFMIETFKYDPYGEVLFGGSLNTKLLYTGHEWDQDSSLYFAPLRYRNVAANRWLSRDPFGMVDGPNRYISVFNSPIQVKDILGGTNQGILGGKCCNSSSGTEHACVDGEWEELEPGECVSTFSDCDGMTCGGGFYYVSALESGDCKTPHEDCPKFKPRRWTPDEQGPEAISPDIRGCNSDDLDYDWD
ncbi:MAG: hypothetical protein HYV26_13375 [Candidatus Hydrogenedentes bacterium]|nr:hypothetical protein [Candidatus Hydrogenedentota bacterium]